MTDTEASEPRKSRPATEAAEPDASAEDSAGSDVERDIDELLEDTQRERDEYLELAKRARADFENYRRRAAEEVREAERRGKSSLARELIPSLDNLERALRAAGIDPDSDDDGEGNGDGGGLAHGVRLVYREIRATLERAGVETYDPTGERFDPRWHEALATRAQEGAEAGVVLETVEKGYRLNGQVLRPARVVVSQ
jgi:molecular chaperone GrpE